jgi:stage V sporulation protein G
MNITEIRIKLVHDPRDKLRGFASITIDDALVIRDLKIIEGQRGLFVAMPSRKLHDRCPSCGCKNPLRARYCNDCGRKQHEQRGELDDRGKVRLYADIAHPIHQSGRDVVQRRVVEAYYTELEASTKDGYVAPRFDDLDYHTFDRVAADDRAERRVDH